MGLLMAFYSVQIFGGILQKRLAVLGDLGERWDIINLQLKHT